MFGFTQAPCRACHPAEASLYQSAFCGVSNRLRRDYGLVFRSLVNRDAAFLSLIAASQLTEPPGPQLETCCNPLGRRRPILSHGAPARFAAAVTACGLEIKIEDELDDERGLRSGLARTLAPKARRAGANARRQLDQLGFDWSPVERKLRSQPEIERSIDADPTLTVSERLHLAAEPTADAFGEITAFTGRASGATTPLRDLGRSLGRLIYWADARDDLDDDRRARRFNPLAVAAGPQDTQAALHEAVQFENDTARQAADELPSLHRPSAQLSKQVLELSLAHNSTATPASGHGEDRRRRRRGSQARWYDGCDVCCWADDCCTCRGCGAGCCRTPQKCCDMNPCDGDCGCGCCECDCCDCC